MTEVYFIRHSLRDNAAYDDMDVPLTAEGEKRALILADAFANVSIEQIFSSPFQRSVRTLNPLAHSKNLEIQDIYERLESLWMLKILFCVIMNYHIRG